MGLFRDNAELNLLKDLFQKYDYPIRFAGGPVRDILQGKVLLKRFFFTKSKLSFHCREDP
jgi:tRNA nucleotidyltransferase/poly(A) polymerase